MTADAWEYAEASDRALGENPAAFSDRVADLAKDPAGAVFLRKDQQRLEMWWNARLAVITHAVSDEKGCEWAVTELSLDRSDSIAKSDLLWWTCSCCGVDLARFLPAMHIRREVAVEIFKHILSSSSRPDVVWRAHRLDGTRDRVTRNAVWIFPLSGEN